MKRTPRIYCTSTLNVGENVVLHHQASRHILHVLRSKLADQLILFNGRGGEYLATIAEIKQNNVIAIVDKFFAHEVESPLKINLGQVISRGGKMDFTIQKAVELGVRKIIPLFAERCNVKLAADRAEKRQQHWQAIAIAACEQCGRNYIPLIEHPQELSKWLNNTSRTATRLILHHESAQTLNNIMPSEELTMLVGCEGGFSENEISLAKRVGFIPVKFGPRVFRTETAALVAMSVMQSRWGDLG